MKVAGLAVVGRSAVQSHIEVELWSKKSHCFDEQWQRSPQHHDERLIRRVQMSVEERGLAPTVPVVVI